MPESRLRAARRMRLTAHRPPFPPDNKVLARELVLTVDCELSTVNFLTRITSPRCPLADLQIDTREVVSGFEVEDGAVEREFRLEHVDDVRCLPKSVTLAFVLDV